MSVMASKTQWNRSELLGDGTSSDYSATATLTPGDWLGTVVFNCLLNKASTYNKYTDDSSFSLLDDGETADGKTFESSDTNVATVDENGVVTIVGEGTTKITVSYIDESGEKQQYTENITIRKRPLFTTSSILPILKNYKDAGNTIENIYFGSYDIPENAAQYDVSNDKSGSIIAFVDENNDLKVTSTGEGPLKFASGDSLRVNSQATMYIPVTRKLNPFTMIMLIHLMRQACTVIFTTVMVWNK